MCVDFTKLNKSCPKRLMNMVFAPHIGRKLEVYVDNMVVKTPKDQKQVKDLEETFGSIRSYNMRLKQYKCIFGVQAGKFLGFILTSLGIEANQDEVQAT